MPPHYLPNPFAPAATAMPQKTIDLTKPEGWGSLEAELQLTMTRMALEERPYMELKRRGEPAEVAAVIAFLCSEHASFVNGANYRVDSGSVATI